MFTEHRVYIKDAGNGDELADASIDLVVTSPPYPMIAMWDDLFSSVDRKIGEALEQGEGWEAFTLMHRQLDRVWQQLARLLKPGAFACINIGDAVRTLKGRFQLYANHSRIQETMVKLGFDPLPLILWRKQTNAPNKFMGSGMLPAGAYVTLEHEYILIFRKGEKRVYHTAEEKLKRMESALFWEERNIWYSDLWDFKGVRQGIEQGDLRARSAAFPFLLPFRLINMYSKLEDVVLDPFFGTGTTALAAIACGRSSIGYELEEMFARSFREKLAKHAPTLSHHNRRRLLDHVAFVQERERQKSPLAYKNDFYLFPVMTKQETKLKLPLVEKVEEVEENYYKATYLDDETAPSMASSAKIDSPDSPIYPTSKQQRLSL